MRMAARAEFAQHYSQQGWVEHDVEDIWRSRYPCVPKGSFVRRNVRPALGGSGRFASLDCATMLESLGSDLWFVDGRIVSFKGFDYPTRMVIVRLADGGLWLWSPIERTAAIEDEVRMLGPVRHIVSPNQLHYLFLAEWQAAFPEAHLWGTPATIAKCGGLHFSGALADDAPDQWRGQIDQFYFANSLFMDEVIFFHRASRTAIIADLSQTFSESFLKRHWPWWMRAVARFSKMTEGLGYPPIDYRISFRRRASARPKIRELIAKHAEHVVVAHGEVVRTGGEAFLRRAFFWLLK